jgi:hypothetical protein
MGSNMPSLRILVLVLCFLVLHVVLHFVAQVE